jgi:hypothetical protein
MVDFDNSAGPATEAAVPSLTDFASLGPRLPPFAARNLTGQDRMKYLVPTPIQKHTVPLALAGLSPSLPPPPSLTPFPCALDPHLTIELGLESSLTILVVKGLVLLVRQHLVGLCKHVLNVSHRAPGNIAS